MYHIQHTLWNLKQAEMAVCFKHFKANFKQVISEHLLYLVYTNVYGKSGIYKELYNVAIQKPSLFRKYHLWCFIKSNKLHSHQAPGRNKSPLITSSMLTSSFSNFRVQQNHGGRVGLLKRRWLGPTPRISDWADMICISNKFLGDIHAACTLFENHWWPLIWRNQIPNFSIYLSKFFLYPKL